MAFVVTRPVMIAGLLRAVGDRIESISEHELADIRQSVVRVADEIATSPLVAEARSYVERFARFSQPSSPVNGAADDGTSSAVQDE